MEYINNIESLMQDLKARFAEYDAERLKGVQELMAKRKAELVAFEASEEGKELRGRGAWGGFYPKVFGIAGGKGWYNVMKRGNLAEFVEKNHAALVEKRNAKLAKQLRDAGIVEVYHAEVIINHDGFNGYYKVKANDGDHVLRIHSILAGGYNIQRLHMRVLISLN